MTQSGGTKNTFFSVTLYNFQKNGKAITLPAPPFPRSPSIRAHLQRTESLSRNGSRLRKERFPSGNRDKPILPRDQILPSQEELIPPQSNVNITVRKLPGTEMSLSQDDFSIKRTPSLASKLL